MSARTGEGRRPMSLFGHNITLDDLLRHFSVDPENATFVFDDGVTNEPEVAGNADQHAVRFIPYTALSVCCLLFNILSLLAMMNIRGPRTVHHILLVNLAICDTLGTVLVWMYHNSPYIFPHFQVTSLRHCLFIVLVLLVPLLLSLVCSALSLLMLAVNQYIAICYPLFSQTRITPGRAWFCIAGAWMISASSALIPVILMLLLTHSEHCSDFIVDMAVKSLEVCAYILAGLIIIIILFYARIYREVLECRRRTFQLTMTSRRPLVNNTLAAPGSTSGGNGTAGSNSGGSGRRGGDPSETNYKAFVTTLLLTGTLVLFWLPYMIFSFLSTHINLDTAPDAFILVKFNLVDFLPMLVYFTDPIIYGIRMREIRRAYRRLAAAVMPCWIKEQNKNKFGGRGSTLRLTSMQEISTSA